MKLPFNWTNIYLTKLSVTMLPPESEYLIIVKTKDVTWNKAINVSSHTTHYSS